MKKLITGLLSFIMLWLSIPTASALGTLPAPNEQQRHIVCTSLSDAAQAYYHDGCQYDSLSALSGAADPATGHTAMQDNELFDALHTLMTATHGYKTSYSGYAPGSLAYFWASTDAVNSGSTYTMFYSDVPADTEGIKLNREHIWPKSRASYVQSNGGADLHHLRPAVSTLNNAKSDHLFGDINGVYTDGVKAGSVNGEICYWVKNDADLFECKDDVKGDVARILLYVYCRWEQPNLYTDVDPALLPPNENKGTNNGKKVVEDLDTHLHHLGVVGGHVDIVDSLVERGVGVDVATELHTVLLQFLDHGVVGIALDAVEGHVLTEVGQTLLVVALHDRTGVADQAELNHVLRLLVVADVVGETIVELAVADFLVQGYLGAQITLFGRLVAARQLGQGGAAEQEGQQHCK